MEKNEKLRSKKLMDLLFREGISRRRGCLRLTYLAIIRGSDVPVQIMFSVSKKQFHRAVDRNLLKRRMREAYKLNKQRYNNKIQIGNKSLLMAFIYADKAIKDYARIESDMQYLIKEIQETL
jgi:ribonuclease P protein component